MPSDIHVYQKRPNTGKDPLFREEESPPLRTRGILISHGMSSVRGPRGPIPGREKRTLEKGSLFPGWSVLMVELCVRKVVPIAGGLVRHPPVLRGRGGEGR